MTRFPCYSFFVCMVFLFLLSKPILAQEYSIAESSRIASEGARLYTAGNLDGAIAALRRAIALWPKNVLAQFNLGLALGDKGDLNGAAAAYEQAVALMEGPPPPNAPAVKSKGPNVVLGEALNNLAVVYYQQNRVDDALLRTEDCISRIPEQTDCLIMQGVLLEAEKRPDEAIVFYRK